MSQIIYHSVAIFVKDIQLSKTFYTQVLGQHIEIDMGKDVILEGGISLWEVWPEHIIPQTLGVDATSTSTANRFELSFECEDIEGIVEKLVASGVEFLHPLHEEPWGQRTVRFFDPDHHLIEVGESMQTFIKRLHASGLSPQQVSQKTGAPLDVVNRFLQG
ncbi:MAG TPA: VOC family protein [Longilinea sp.]|nr:VOC family protein [Longilinea sp.]